VDATRFSTKCPTDVQFVVQSFFGLGHLQTVRRHSSSTINARAYGWCRCISTIAAAGSNIQWSGHWAWCSNAIWCRDFGSQRPPHLEQQHEESGAGQQQKHIRRYEQCHWQRHNGSTSVYASEQQRDIRSYCLCVLHRGRAHGPNEPRWPDEPGIPGSDEPAGAAGPHWSPESSRPWDAGLGFLRIPGWYHSTSHAHWPRVSVHT